MGRTPIVILTVMALAGPGCQRHQRDGEDIALQVPMEIRWDASEPVRLRSGQMVVPPFCCPPLELRDAQGTVVQEFDFSAGKQPLVASAGSYVLVGHDPAGVECVLHIEVTSE